jgi:outer membrane protein
MSRMLHSFVVGLGLAVGLGLVASLGIGSVNANPSSTIRIASIDLEQTLYNTPAGKRASDAFDKTRKSKQAEYDNRQKELQKAAAELDKQAAMLKPDVLAEKKAVLEKQFAELRQAYTKLEGSLAQERTKLIQDLLKKAGPIIEEIAKADGIDIVFDHSAVLWAVPTVDLTPKLNARMK